jgi:hypothetical protein
MAAANVLFARTSRTENRLPLFLIMLIWSHDRTENRLPLFLIML